MTSAFTNKAVNPTSSLLSVFREKQATVAGEECTSAWGAWSVCSAHGTQTEGVQGRTRAVGTDLSQATACHGDKEVRPCELTVCSGSDGVETVLATGATRVELGLPQFPTTGVVLGTDFIDDLDFGNDALAALATAVGFDATEVSLIDVIDEADGTVSLKVVLTPDAACENLADLRANAPVDVAVESDKQSPATVAVTLAADSPFAVVTCADGTQNGDEFGVDCGGSCPTACAEVSDLVTERLLSGEQWSSADNTDHVAFEFSSSNNVHGLSRLVTLADAPLTPAAEASVGASALMMYTGDDNGDKASDLVNVPNGLFNGVTLDALNAADLVTSYWFWRAPNPGAAAANGAAAPALVLRVSDRRDDTAGALLVYEPYWSTLGGLKTANSNLSPTLDSQWLQMTTAGTDATMWCGASGTTGGYEVLDPAGKICNGCCTGNKSLQDFKDALQAEDPTLYENTIISGVFFNLGTYNQGLTTYVDALEISLTGETPYTFNWELPA